jgi:hypothetical protein
VEPNVLVIRIQPNEGITLRFVAKLPGQAMRIRQVNMDFRYGNSFGIERDASGHPSRIYEYGPTFAGREERFTWRANGLVENVDVAPTILRLLGVDAMQGVEGRPLLVAQDAGAGAPARFVPAPGRPFTYAESDFQLIHPENPRYYVRGPAGRWTSASDGRYKLILIPRAGDELVEMYDLERDPAEEHDRSGDPALAEVRGRLLREVKQYSDYGAGPGGTGPGATPADPDSLSPEERARLRSLGYVN